ncbi:cytochrome P450 2J6-like [Haliotis asinina]|uniref:cytochrome P450 2J6-like n=1 Tax=Haliotis asinina TaxID=109174 RepID=UPI003531CAF1
MDVVLFVFFLVFSVCLLYTHASRDKRRLPPGPYSIPLIGNVIQLLLNRENLQPLFERLHKQHGNVFRLHLGNKLLVVVKGFDANHEALVQRGLVMTGKPSLFPRQRNTGVIFSHGTPWRNGRRLTLRGLRDFGVGKALLDTNMTEEMSHILEYLSANEGSPISLRTFIRQASLNVSSSLVFGHRFDYKDGKFQSMLELLVQMFAFAENWKLPFMTFLGLRNLPSVRENVKQFMWGFINVFAMIKAAVKERESTFDASDVRDFLDTMIIQKQENSLPYSESVPILMDVLVGSVGTFSATLDWFLLYMVRNPDEQARCQEQIDHMVGRGRPVRLSDRASLPYVEATVAEVQRLGSVVSFTLRQNLEETTINGYTIPKDTTVLCNLQSCHTDNKYWPDPHTFRPERFLDSEGRFNRKQLAFLPFSAGPRQCVGEILAKDQLFVFTVTLLQHFKFSRPEGEVLDDQQTFISARCARPFKIVATKR